MKYKDFIPAKNKMTFLKDKTFKKKKYFKKRYILLPILFCALVLSVTFIPPVRNLLAATDDKATDTLTENVRKSLEKIDFGDLDEITKSLKDSDFNLFKSDSFASKVGKIISGEFINDYPNVFAAILALFAGVVVDVLPVIIMVIAITMLCGFMQTLKHQSSGEGVRDIIHFVSYSAVIVIVLSVVMDLSLSTGAALGSMKKQMDIIFPILLTMMAAIGGTVSVGVYQPAVVILSSGIMQIFTYIVMPLFFMTLVFSVVGNLSSGMKFDKFVAFFTSSFKWIVGITFTVFLSFLTIQGISAGTHDGISIRAAKLTISSYVPFLGSYISQGFDLVMASSVLIKNAVGVAGLYLLFGVILAPVLKIVVFILGLKLAAAITQPIADARISNFLSSIVKSFNMLVACLIGAAFMYFLTVGLVICSGNIM